MNMAVVESWGGGGGWGGVGGWGVGDTVCNLHASSFRTVHDGEF